MALARPFGLMAHSLVGQSARSVRSFHWPPQSTAAELSFRRKKSVEHATSKRPIGCSCLFVLLAALIRSPVSYSRTKVGYYTSIQWYKNNNAQGTFKVGQRGRRVCIGFRIWRPSSRQTLAQNEPNQRAIGIVASCIRVLLPMLALELVVRATAAEWRGEHLRVANFIALHAKQPAQRAS